MTICERDVVLEARALTVRRSTSMSGPRRVLGATVFAIAAISRCHGVRPVAVEASHRQRQRRRRRSP